VTTTPNETSDRESIIDRRSVLKAAALGGSTLAFGRGAAEAKKGNGGRANEYLVGTNSKEAERKANERAEKVRRTMDFDRTGKVVQGRYSPKAAEKMRQRDDTRYVTKDTTVQTHGQTNPWGIERLDAPLAHDNGETSSGANVALLDTGIDPSHETLSSNVGTGRSEVRCKGNCETDWDDDHGHGTHVAGTANAVDNGTGIVGVATEATLHAVKVLEDDGSGWSSDLAAGIEWATDNGCDVINMSLGGFGDLKSLREACQYAYDNGVVLVASAGNNGPCSDCVSYPAAYNTVIAVSATSSDDSLADFSSTGPEIEFAAPGESVYSSTPDNNYGYWNGTSMAAPHVAGSAAHLMSNGYTNTEARQRLQDTAEDIGLSSNEQGHGLVDTSEALGVSNSGPSCSVTTPSDGATVSGTVTIGVDAGDKEDDNSNLDVEVYIGGRWISATYSNGTYKYDWDTTTENEGDITLRARVTDSRGASTSSGSRTVTVDNQSSSDNGGDEPQQNEDDSQQNDDGSSGCSGICVWGIDVVDLTLDITQILVDFTIDFTVDMTQWAVVWVFDMSGNSIGRYRTSKTSGGATMDSATFDIPADLDEVEVRLEAYNEAEGLADVEMKRVSL
jgi:subtilisin